VGGAMIEILSDMYLSYIGFLGALIIDIKEIFQDMFVWAIDLFLTSLALNISNTPVPEFLSNGIGYYFQSLDSSILYFLDMSGIIPAFSLLGAGATFRLTRKILTMGIW
jgi:hypothetical protein